MDFPSLGLVPVVGQSHRDALAKFVAGDLAADVEDESSVGFVGEDVAEHVLTLTSLFTIGASVTYFPFA